MIPSFFSFSRKCISQLSCFVQVLKTFSLVNYYIWHHKYFPIGFHDIAKSDKLYVKSSSWRFATKSKASLIEYEWRGWGKKTCLHIKYMVQIQDDDRLRKKKKLRAPNLSWLHNEKNACIQKYRLLWGRLSLWWVGGEEKKWF